MSEQRTPSGTPTDQGDWASKYFTRPPDQPPSQPPPSDAALTPTAQGEWASNYFSGGPKPPQSGGYIANIGAGTNEAVTSWLGLPMDLYTGTLNAGISAANSIMGTSIPYATNYGGTQSLRALEHLYGGAPEDVQAVTLGEQIARTGARGGTTMFLPGAAARAVPEAALAAALPSRVVPAAEAVRSAFASGATSSGVLTGIAGEELGAGARSIAPDPYKPLAETIGNIVGGGPVSAIAGRLERQLEPAIQRAVQGHVEAGPDIGLATKDLTPQNIVAAGRRILGAAKGTDPSIGMPETPIEGFQPTLGQQSGDLGVLALERELRNRYRDLFIAHDATNNAALRRALGELAPEEASATLGNYVRSQLDALSTSEEMEEATTRAQQATQALGGQPGTTTAADLGAAARDRLEEFRLNLNNLAKQALEAVDPEGKLALHTDNVSAAAHGLLGTEGAVRSRFTINSRAGEKANGAESDVLDAAARMPVVSSFNDLRDLLGQVSAAQRAIRRGADPLGAESRSYARMRELRSAIQDAMANGAEHAAAANQRTSAGEQWRPVEPGEVFQPGASFRMNIATGAQETTAPHPGTGAGPTPAPESLEAGLTAQRDAWYRDQGITPPPGAATAQEEALAPNFHQQAADNLEIANRAYADYKQTFRRGPIGDVLASGNSVSGYRMGNADVVKALFPSGPRGTDAADALIRAAGSPEAAERVLGDYPAYSLRLFAERNGIIDPKLHAQWMDMNHYGPVLARFPPLRQRLSDPAQASQELADSALRLRQAREGIEDSALRHYLNLDADVNPRMAIDRLMREPTAASQAQDLMRAASTNPDLVASARRNAVDWIWGKITTTAESGTSGQRELSKAALQRILEGNPAQEQALKIILGPERFAMLGRISDAMDRGARAHQAVGIKGSPGTAADVHAIRGHEPTLLGDIAVGDAIGEMAGHAISAAANAAGIPTPPSWLMRPIGVIAGFVRHQRRMQGIESTHKLATLGVLNPELGRILMGAAAKSPGDPRLVRMVRQLSVLGLSNVDVQGRQGGGRQSTLTMAPGQGYRAGGRVRLQGGGDVEPAPAAPPSDVPPLQSIAARMVEPQPQASLLPPESGGQQYLSQGPLDSPTVPMSQVVDPSLVFTPGTGAHTAYEQNLEKAADVALSLGPGISVGRVYHGSPHKFAPVEGAPYGRFDISRMGSGQGAQTFGEGAYFAEAQPVAEGYKGEDVGRDWTLSDETGKIPSWVAKDIAQHQPGSESYHARIDTAINEFQNRVAEQHANIAANRDPWMSRDRVTGLGQIVSDLQRLKSGEVTLRPPGYLYDVDVAAEQEHFLDWDKPLSEQPDEIKKMLGYEGIVGAPSNDEVVAVMRQAREAGIPLRDYEPYKELQSRRAEAEKFTLQKLGIRDDPNIPVGDLSGSALYTGLLEKHGTPWEVAKYLGQLGLKGIRYFDQGSRAGGKGTRNYVIFDPGPITTITGRRNSGGAIPRAPAPPPGVFWRGGAIVPQATPYRFH